MNSTPHDTITKAFRPRFEILEQIGEGGMARVYKAIEVSLNRYVALKIIHPGIAHDREFLTRFHREAQLCSAVGHPNIVTIYEEGEMAGIHYLSMELLEGVTLDQIISSYGRLDPETTFSYLIPIARALEFTHRKGLIHRDVKSSNIFITRDGRSVLMDFGIAHSNSFLTVSQTGAVIGTPAYMSPEQASGTKLDARSDIYSFGVVLFECLAGSVPLHASNPVSTIHLIIYQQPPLLNSVAPDVPEWLSEVTGELLRKDPENRPHSISQVIYLLDNPGKRSYVGNPEKSPMLLYSAVGLLIGLLGILVFYISFNRSEPEKRRSKVYPASFVSQPSKDTTPVILVNDSSAPVENIIIYNQDSTEILYFYQRSLTNNDEWENSRSK